MKREVISGKEATQKLSKELLKKVDDLPEGKVMAVYMRNANSSDPNKPKVVIEFAEKINLTDNNQVNALNLFNADDDRFSTRKSRRCWVTASEGIAEQILGVGIPEGEAMVELGKVLNPVNGKEFRLRIVEKLESQATPSQKDYIENYLKLRPSDGAHYYDSVTGERVISTTELVQVEQGVDVDHVLIDGEWVSNVTTFKSAATESSKMTP